jgi:hypothetical protein
MGKDFGRSLSCPYGRGHFIFWSFCMIKNKIPGLLAGLFIAIPGYFLNPGMPLIVPSMLIATGILIGEAIHD